MATPPPLRWVLWRSISVVASERRISFLLSKDFVLSDKILPWNFTIPARFCSSDTKWCGPPFRFRGGLLLLDFLTPRCLQGGHSTQIYSRNSASGIHNSRVFWPLDCDPDKHLLRVSVISGSVFAAIHRRFLRRIRTAKTQKMIKTIWKVDASPRLVRSRADYARHRTFSVLPVKVLIIKNPSLLPHRFWAS